MCEMSPCPWGCDVPLTELSADSFLDVKRVRCCGVDQELEMVEEFGCCECLKTLDEIEESI